jgi:hypothetical protein
MLDKVAPKLRLPLVLLREPYGGLHIAQFTQQQPQRLPLSASAG